MISAYALVFGGFLLLGGRTADLLGRRRVFIAGTIIFTVGSLLCGLAWSDTSLIGARAIQGLGAATVTPAALAILVRTFQEGRERNIALGAWGAVGGVGAAAGVLLGGVLTSALSWEWIFFINVPVGAIALVLSPILLTESRDAHGQTFDVPGAVLVTGGLTTLVYAITEGVAGAGPRRRRSPSSPLRRDCSSRSCSGSRARRIRWSRSRSSGMQTLDCRERRRLHHGHRASSPCS